jgi:hypothetical protein
MKRTSSYGEQNKNPNGNNNRAPSPNGSRAPSPGFSNKKARNGEDDEPTFEDELMMMEEMIDIEGLGGNIYLFIYIFV